jgi:hypothetical protein
MALATDQHWWKGRYLHEVIGIHRSGITFVGQVRATGFEVRRHRIIGAYVSGPKATGEVKAVDGGKTTVSVQITFYPELAIFTFAMLALPSMFFRVLGLVGLSIFLTAQVLLWGLALRAGIRGLLRSLEDTLQLRRMNA